MIAVIRSLSSPALPDRQSSAGLPDTVAARHRGLVGLAESRPALCLGVSRSAWQCFEASRLVSPHLLSPLFPSLSSSHSKPPPHSLPLMSKTKTLHEGRGGVN